MSLETIKPGTGSQEIDDIIEIGGIVLKKLREKKIQIAFILSMLCFGNQKVDMEKYNNFVSTQQELMLPPARPKIKEETGIAEPVDTEGGLGGGPEPIKKLKEEMFCQKENLYKNFHNITHSNNYYDQIQSIG